jgi:ABC-type transport system substrate-binding protein
MAQVTRRTALLGAAGAATVAIAPARAAERTLRIAMTAADIPLTTGGPDNGFEGFRFTGYTIYDPLVAWDLSHSDRPSTLIAGLATEWAVDPADKRTWIFKLRSDVRFHDGSAFDAQAVVWNLAKLLDEKAPQFDPKQSAQIRGRITSLASWKIIDAHTVALMTHEPDSLFAYQMTFILFSSPAQFEALGRDWNAFARAPSGTGPWKLDRLVPRERAELVPNREYWNPERRAKIDRVVLLPVPDAFTRASALLSGQVDWAEAPPSDTIAQLRASGKRILTNVYPHVWTYMLSFLPDSPFADVRMRKAVNLAIDREGLATLLGGMMIPASGTVPPGHPWYGKPSFHIRLDRDEARRLLTEAGYTRDRPLTLRVLTSPSGSGQMLPLPMNEFIQQNLQEVGIKLELEVVEWGALLGRWRAGAQSEQNHGIPALNTNAGTFDPFNAFFRFYSGALAAPRGLNWGQFSNPDYDAMIKQIQITFDPAEQDGLLAALHQRAVDDALFVWVGHDVNPRALSAEVKDVVVPQSWYIDLTTIRMG